MIAAVRIVQLVLTGSIALFALVVGWNNLMDYDSNWQFVRHVLSMDTTFPGTTLISRAIHSPAAHQAAYWLIIAAELTFPGTTLISRAIHSPAAHQAAYWLIIAAELGTGLLTAWGFLSMALHFRDAGPRFEAAKARAVLGIALGLGLWFTGFFVVAGEWFAMWQSSQWNGRVTAFQFCVLLLLSLIVLLRRDPR